ncbi:MAG: DUF1700 domain-containing protein [Ruminococcus sp.]|nr:DUF1700 domain-containing protein [Ruminococcus sp.]
MNRLEFLTELRTALAQGGLPHEDIEDAMRYYEEVFLDAGPSNEEDTAATLGDPAAIARDILMENGIHADGESAFMMSEAAAPGQQPYGSADAAMGSHLRQNTGSNNSKMILILLLISFPIWIGPFFAVLGIVMSAYAVLGVFWFLCVVLGITAIVSGIYNLFAIPPIGFMMIGAGFILMSLTGLVALPLLRLLTKGVRALFNWLRGVILRALGREEAA